MGRYRCSTADDSGAAAIAYWLGSTISAVRPYEWLLSTRVFQCSSTNGGEWRVIAGDRSDWGLELEIASILETKPMPHSENKFYGVHKA